jgi:phosphopantetheinyl transferase (holo-ACP synthase)
MPVLELTGDLAEKEVNIKFTFLFSHTKENAIAFVVMEEI